MHVRHPAVFVICSSIVLAVPAVPRRDAAGQGAPAGLPTAAAAVRDAAAPLPLVLLRRSTKQAPDGSGLDVLVPANLQADEIARRVARIASDPAGFTQFALRLDASAKRYLAREVRTVTARGPMQEPAYLFLSDHEGGFPSESFWLEQPDGSLRQMRDVAFVDLVVRERDLVPGDIDGFEAVFAHELGHLVMAALAGPAPKRPSNAVHFVTARTDAWYAFIEGWGEHFQPMAADGDGAPPTAVPERPSSLEVWWYERFSHEQVDGCWICPANLRFLAWQGRREQRLRGGALRSGLFAREPALPARLLTDARPVKEARMYRDLAEPRPTGRLKNGPQMLSSEGLVAALFYRLAGDERLRNGYRDADFYAQFLPDDQASTLAALGPRALVSPAENVYLKLFEVLHGRFRWGSWPALELVSAYAARFPEDAAAVYDVFLDVTRGVTVEREAAQRHLEPGYLAGLRDRLVARSARIDANVGPPLWISAPGMTLGMGVFRYFPVPSSFTFDLNAADVVDLRSMPGVGASLAARIVSVREQRGPFAGAADLAAVPEISPGLLSAFRERAEAMQKRLDRTETRRTDPAWMKAILAPMLRGSYYLAAAWQFGTALVLSGLAFLAVRGSLRRLQGRHDKAAADRVRRPVWRRVLAGLLPGAAAAALPLAISVGLYRAGYFPTAANMAAVGAGLGLCAWASSVLLHRRRGDRRQPAFPAMSTLLAWTTMAAVIGWMY